MKNGLRLRRRKVEPKTDAALLAPPEEAQAVGTDSSGNDGPKVTISPELMDGSDQGSLLDVDPVVIAIVLGALAFIAFIAWEVHRMPWPPVNQP
jgi:hypothetical protein